MLAQGKTIQRIKQSIHRKKDIQLTTPQKLNYPQIKEQLMKAANQIRTQNKKMINVLRDRQKHKSYQLQLRKVMSITPYAYNSVLNPLNISVWDVANFSSIPYLQKKSFEMLTNLIQIQDQIDPHTKDLIKMPGTDHYVTSYVTVALSKTTSTDLFNFLISTFGIHDTQKLRQIQYVILENCNKMLQYFGYIIRQQQAMEIFFNPRYEHPISKQQIQNLHTKSIQHVFEKISFLTPGFDFLITYAQQMLSIKRKSYQNRDNSFFSVLKPEQLQRKDQIIRNSLFHQNNLIVQNNASYNQQLRLLLQRQRQLQRQRKRLQYQNIMRE